MLSATPHCHERQVERAAQRLRLLLPLGRDGIVEPRGRVRTEGERAREGLRERAEESDAHAAQEEADARGHERDGRGRSRWRREQCRGNSGCGGICIGAREVFTQSGRRLQSRRATTVSACENAKGSGRARVTATGDTRRRQHSCAPFPPPCGRVLLLRNTVPPRNAAPLPARPPSLSTHNARCRRRLHLHRRNS